jgi:fused-like protein
MDKGVKSNVKDILVPIMAAGILGDVVGSETCHASQTITQRYLSQNSMALLNQIMDVSQSKSDIKRVDGNNFGCPFLGYYDYPYKMMRNIINKASKNEMQGLVNSLNNNNVSDTIMSFFLNISSKSEISPKGFLNILEIVYDTIVTGYNDMTTKIFKNCLKMLCSFLRENQLLAI